MAEEHSDLPPATTLPPTLSGDQKPTPAEGPLSKEVLKSAYNAFKKRWKLTRLDHESRIGRGPMSSGQKSTIVGIVPPDQFPGAVWEALVKQGKLKHAGRGCYSLP
jgi:hypothetical protein